MTTSKEIAVRILNLSPTEFFGENLDFTDREFALLGQDFEGVAINAPATIDLLKWDRLPMALATIETTRRQWEVYRGKNLTLLAWQIDSGTVYIGAAYPPPEKLPAREGFSRQPPEPRETAPYTKNARIELLQVRERLNLPWQSCRFRLAVVNYDWVSNVVEVELKGEGRLEEGKLQAVRPEPAPQPAGQKPILPCYEVLPTTPRPSQEGLEFLVQSEMAVSNRLPVSGAFVTRARKWYIDRTGTVHLGIGGKRLSVVAVVPLTLVVFGLDWGVPKRFDWAVPVYGAAPAEEGGRLAGYFAIDALHGSDVRLPPGRYVTYILCDSRIYGPREFKIRPG